MQTVLEQQPLSGHVVVLRGRRGDIVKVLWFDGDGLCLLAKRLERGPWRLLTCRISTLPPPSMGYIPAFDGFPRAQLLQNILMLSFQEARRSADRRPGLRNNRDRCPQQRS